MARLLAILAIATAVAAAGCRPAAAPQAAVTPNAPESVPDRFAVAGAALAWPGATRAFLAGPAGALENGAFRVMLDPTVDAAGAAAGGATLRPGPPARIAYEGRWLPVVHWTRRAGAVTFEFEAVAGPAPEAPWARAARELRDWQARQVDAAVWQSERERLAHESLDRLDRLVVGASHHVARSADDATNMLVSIEVRARNAGSTPAEVRLRVDIAPVDARAAFHDAGPPAPLPADPFRTAPAESLAVAWCGAGGGDVIAAQRLAPGAACAGRLVVSAYPLRAGTLARWAAVPHARRVAEARAYWEAETERGTRFELGDPAVESAIAAARVVLLECRERRDGRWVPLGGPFHYRDVWLRDGARAIAALACHGYVNEARALAESFLEWQWPHGPFVSQGAQLDGTGQALWAFEQSMLRPAPAADVGRYASAALDAWSWCERTRRRAGEPSAGLLPAADPHDNELVRARLVGTDAWALAGYRATARLLEAAGRTADADRVEQAGLAYRRDFAAALAHAVDLPPAYDGRGRDWGNLAVGYPCAALPAESPRLDALARRYWAAAGGAGLGYYGSPDSLHGYVAADLGTWALRRGWRAAADSVLAALLEWRDASGGGAELFTRAGDFGTNLPPHATTAAALLQLVRNGLIDDDGDRLALTEGARSGWWRGSRVVGAPTRWGDVTVEFRAANGVASWSWTPVGAWTALTLPPGTALAAPPPPPLLRGERPDQVLAPPGCARASIAIRAG